MHVLTIAAFSAMQRDDLSSLDTARCPGNEPGLDGRYSPRSTTLQGTASVQKYCGRQQNTAHSCKRLQVLDVQAGIA